MHRILSYYAPLIPHSGGKGRQISMNSRSAWTTYTSSSPQPRLHAKISTQTKRWSWYYPSVSVLFNWLWAWQRKHTAHACTRFASDTDTKSCIQLKTEWKSRTQTQNPQSLDKFIKEMCAVLRYPSWAMGGLHRQEEALLHRDRIRDAERGRTDLAPIESEDSEGLKNSPLCSTRSPGNGWPAPASAGWWAG